MNKKINTNYGQVQITDREKPAKIGKFIFLVSAVISYISVITFFTYNLDIAKTTGNQAFATAGFIICSVYAVLNTVFLILQYNNAKSKGLKKGRGYASKVFKYITIGLKCALILTAAFTMLIAAKNFGDVGNALLKALTIFSLLISVFLDIALHFVKKKFKKKKGGDKPDKANNTDLNNSDDTNQKEGKA